MILNQLKKKALHQKHYVDILKTAILTYKKCKLGYSSQ